MPLPFTLYSSTCDDHNTYRMLEIIINFAGLRDADVGQWCGHVVFPGPAARLRLPRALGGRGQQEEGGAAGAAADHPQDSQGRPGLCRQCPQLHHVAVQLGILEQLIHISSEFQIFNEK